MTTWLGVGMLVAGLGALVGAFFAGALWLVQRITGAVDDE